MNGTNSEAAGIVYAVVAAIEPHLNEMGLRLDRSQLHLEAKIIELRNETVASREALIHVRNDMAILQAQIDKHLRRIIEYQVALTRGKHKPFPA